MSQIPLLGDDLKQWVALGLPVIENYDPGLFCAIQRINEDPDAMISSDAFNSNFMKFQQVFAELCGAEEEIMANSKMPRDKLGRHAEDHLVLLEKIHHVYYDAMNGDVVKAKQIHEKLVSEIYRHLVDFHINHEY